MIRKLLTVFWLWLLLLPLTAQGVRPYESVAGDPLGVRIYTLGNGMKVYLSANHEMPSIHTFIAVRAGGKNDPPETTGLAHYLEHLLFKGTTHFGTLDYASERPLLDSVRSLYEVYRHVEDPARRKAIYHRIDSVSNLASHYAIANEYDRLMSGLGALGTNAATTQDATYYIENIPANEIEPWAAVESERFRNMVIRGFHTELESVYEEYNLSLTDDGEKATDSIFRMLFPGHPYGTQTVIGSQKHLKNPSIANIERYFEHYYIPSNMAVCMSGDLDYDKTIDIIDRYFGSWTKGSPLPATVRQPLPPITSPQTTTLDGPESDQIIMAWRMPSAADPRADIVEIISQLLDNGQAGLFNIDLDLQQRVINPGAEEWLLAEHGLLFVSAEPKEGQTLDEVKQILVDEVGKLARGEFSDELLKAVVDNMKLSRMENFENNEQRATLMLDAFINHTDWSSVVNGIRRMERITRQDIMGFASQWLTDQNYVCVYKRQGADPNEKKIEKPAISPIEMNRSKTSDFVDRILTMPVDSITPRFVDMKHDYSTVSLKKGNVLNYKKNDKDQRFFLKLVYDKGCKADPYLTIAANNLTYFGSKHLSAEEMQQKLYMKACSVDVSAYTSYTDITVSGLVENQAEAIGLMKDWIWNLKIDKDVYDEMLADIEAKRQQYKGDIDECFQRLWNYVSCGTKNLYTDMPGVEQLRKAGPKRLAQAFDDLKRHRLQVFYYGPEGEDSIREYLEKNIFMPARAQAADVVKNVYREQQTPQNEVYLLNFDSKALRMGMISNDGQTYDPARHPLAVLFNQYFNGNMNSLLFQEMRESRGLVYSVDGKYKIPWYGQGFEEFNVSMSTQNDKMDDCIDVMNQILNRQPKDENSFQLAKQAVLKQMATERFRGAGLLEYVFDMQQLGLDHDIDADVYEKVKTYTLDDLARFCKEHVAGRTFRYLILGDEKQIDMEKLKAIGPVHRLSLKDVFGY